MMIDKNKQQKILKEFYDNKQDIKAYDGRSFPVKRPRTCRNCYFYDDCPFPQKINPNFEQNDFKNPQNRYKWKPAGYCVPVKYFIGHFDVPGDAVGRAVNEIFKILED